MPHIVNDNDDFLLADDDNNNDDDDDNNNAILSESEKNEKFGFRFHMNVRGYVSGASLFVTSFEGE